MNKKLFADLPLLKAAAVAGLVVLLGAFWLSGKHSASANVSKVAKPKALFTHANCGTPATGDAGGFEIDGNLVAGGVTDWLSVINNDGSIPPGSNAVRLRDEYGNLNTDDIFGGGLKIDDPLNNLTWELGNAPDKDDLNNGLLHASVSASGDTWFMVAADRGSNRGDSYIDFEFLQNSLSKDVGGKFTSGAPATTGGRTVGDVTITLAFTNGGREAEYYVQQWRLIAPGVYGYVDVMPIPAGAVWVCLNTAPINVPFGAFGGTTLDAYQFIEAALNLSALLPPESKCLSFATVWMRTKVSQSFNAQIKDFIAPQAKDLGTTPVTKLNEVAPICQGQKTTITATVTGGAPPYSYAWTRDGNTFNGNQSSIEVDTAGRYCVTVTDNRGCASKPACASLVVKPLPDATITAPTAVCALFTGNKAAVPDAGTGATYEWTLTGGTITGGAGTPEITWRAGSGAQVVIEVKVTKDGCSATSRKTVTINPLPDVMITAPDAVCAFSSGNGASVPDAGINATYVWEIGNGTITDGASTRGIKWSAAGNTPVMLRVKVTTGAGCLAEGEKMVMVNPLPIVTITAPEAVCAFSQGNLASVPDAGGGATYVWTITNGTITEGTGTRSIKWSAMGSTPVTLSVKVTTTAGCIAESAQRVSVNPLPTPVITGPSEVCFGLSVTLDAGAGYRSYRWSTGATTQTITVSPSATTSYAVTVVNDAGCEATSAPKEVKVNALPTPVISGPGEVCLGQLVTLDAGDYRSYLWSTGATTRTITVSPTMTTSYSVRVVNGNGCEGTSPSKEVKVNPLPEPVITGPNDVCLGQAVTLDAGDGYRSYLWSTGATTRTITVSPSATTSYRVQVESNAGCFGTSSAKTVVVKPITTATTLTDQSVCRGAITSFTVTAGGTGPFTYQWTLDGNPAGNNNAMVTIDTASLSIGAHNVSVVVTGSCGTVTRNAMLTVQSCATFCTLTQGGYSNQKRGSLVYELLRMSDPLVVGVKDLANINSRWLEIPAASAYCLIEAMPAGGTPRPLLESGTIRKNSSCIYPSQLMSRDRFNNVLIGQSIALSLNLRWNAMNGRALGAYPLCRTIITAQALPGPDGVVGTKDDIPNMNYVATFTIPPAVFDRLGANPTVERLLMMANQALAGTLPPGSPTLSEINNAVDAVNRAFDECRIVISCGN